MVDRVIITERAFDLAGVAVEGGARTVVRGGRIVAVEPAGGAAVSDLPVHEYAGATLLPGLINMHAHVAFSAGDDPVGDMIADSDLQLMIRAVEHARLSLSAGVTTLRDLGDRGGVSIALRDAINRGLVKGPRMFVAGAPITTTGGHCHYMGLEADHADDLRRAVRQQVKAGVDLIKIMATGGGLTPGSNLGAPQFSLAELTALVQDARRLNRRVAAHAHGTAGIRYAAEAGVTTIEHCSWRAIGDGFVWDDSAAYAVIENDVFVCFTLSAGYRRTMAADPNDPAWAKRRSDRNERAIHQRRLVEAGARVIAGSDAGVPHTRFEDFPLEVELLVKEIGLTPAAALAAATSVAAEALGQADRIGSLGVGRQADLLIVDGDPRADVSALRRVVAVYRDGDRVV